MYQIVDWDQHFETADTRKRVRPLPRVLMPTKHDGLTYRRLMRRSDRMAILGAWLLIVEVAAKCPVRGRLAGGDGAAMTADDIADKTGGDPAVIQEALIALTDPDIGWIENLPDHADTVDDVGMDRQGPADVQTYPSAGTGRCSNEKVRPNETEPNVTEPNVTERLPAPSDSVKPADTSASDSSEAVAKLRYWKKIEPLFRGSDQQRAADQTCAERWWLDHIWPDRTDRMADLIDRAKRTKRPMAYITARLKSGQW